MTRAPAEVGSAANSYEILAKLAMGGMAEIFLARGANAAGVERYVVLKRVLRNRASDEHFVRMFLDEARLAAQLQHPNVAQVYDIGKLGDSYFFTMEYVHGETVRTLLQRSHGLRRTIPIGNVLSIIAGAAAGLHHAHERKGIDGKPLGIVHRDVSPSNLMVSYEGAVKVVDFGVAKAQHRSHETQSGTVKGKISYMSPEQCRGLDIDRRSDLFSVGIVMWEMLTTERLFRRASDFENMQAIVHDTVVPPSSLRPEIPPEIDHIVLRLLAKNPADRYQTGDDLHEAVENAAVRTGSALSPVSLGRYMRELFGQRPEPWIELSSFETHPEAFTVTSEPIAAELSVSAVSDELDLKLESLPRMSAEHTSAATPQALEGGKLGTTVRVEADDLASTVLEPPSHNVLPFTPAPRPSSHPPFPLQYSSSHIHSLAHAAAFSQQPRPRPRRSRALLIIVPGIVLGVVIGIALALGGSDDKQPRARPVMTTPAPTVVAKKPEPPKPAPPPPPALAPVPPEPPAKPSLQALFADQHYAEVVAACATATKAELAADAASCTISACKQREGSKARRWLASVAVTGRAAVIKECAGLVQLEVAKKPPAPDKGSAEDPCKQDMLACQH